MKAITTWLFIAATILISLAGLSVRAEEAGREFSIELKVTTKSPDSLKYYAVTSDWRVIGIVCNPSLARTALNWSAQYSADLVFPTDEGTLDLDNYRSSSPSRTQGPPKPAYRPLSPEDAKKFCDHPQGQVTFIIGDDYARFQSHTSIKVQSFGVGRRYL